jgi:hypothetical protein
LRAYVNYLQDDWVHWLTLVKFAYNNRVRASTGITPFFTEKGFHLSIEATVQAILADQSIPTVPDTKAQAEKLVKLWATIEQH